MIQFNLLPDIKLEYIKAARTKRTMIIMSTFASIATIAIVALMSAYTFGVRGSHLANLEDDIRVATSDLENTEDIDKILTVQNQLSSLPTLHDTKSKMSALYTYLGQLTPEGVALNEIEVNIETLTFSISGEAESLPDVNQFVDTFKFTSLVIQPELSEGQTAEDVEPEVRNAFTNVVLDSFSLDEETVSYTINLVFDEDLFSNTKQVSLNVPTKFSTRSETEKPLFQEPTVQDSGEENAQ